MQIKFRSLVDFGFAAAAVVALIAVSPGARAEVIESFDSGSLDPAWVGTPSAATVSPTFAHDGAYGATTNSEWYYRTDPAAQLSTGDTLSAWVKFTSTGRAYLGFGADAGGASSFVLASNSDHILFQNNEGWDFEALNAASFTFALNQWYLAEVQFNVGSIVGNIYGSDGETLLASLTASGLTNGADGGVAFRSFAAGFDSISTSAVVAVPGPIAGAGVPALFGLAGVWFYRRRKSAAAARNPDWS